MCLFYVSLCVLSKPRMTFRPSRTHFYFFNKNIARLKVKQLLTFVFYVYLHLKCITLLRLPRAEIFRTKRALA